MASKTKAKVINYGIDLTIEDIDPLNPNGGEKILDALNLRIPDTIVMSSVAEWKEQRKSLLLLDVQYIMNPEEAPPSVGRNFELQAKEQPSLAALFSQMYRENFERAYIQFRDKNFGDISNIQERNEKMKNLSLDQREKILEKFKRISLKKIEKNGDFWRNAIVKEEGMNQTNFRAICVFLSALEFNKKTREKVNEKLSELIKKTESTDKKENTGEKAVIQEQIKVLSDIIKESEQTTFQPTKEKYDSLKKINPLDFLKEDKLKEILLIITNEPPFEKARSQINQKILKESSLDSLTFSYGTDSLTSSNRTSRSDLSSSYSSGLSDSENFLKSSEKLSKKQKNLLQGAKKNNSKLVKESLEQGADVNTQDRKGETALHYSVKNENESLTNLLRSYGANATLKNRAGFSPLELAQNQENTVMVSILQKTPELSGSNDIAETIITKISLGLSVDSTTLTNANMEYQKLENETILRAAIRCNVDIDLIRAIIDKMTPKQLNKQDKEGNTALFTALTKGNQAVFKLLLEKGASTTIRNNRGQTVFRMVEESKASKNTKRKEPFSVKFQSSIKSKSSTSGIKSQEKSDKKSNQKPTN